MKTTLTTVLLLLVMALPVHAADEPRGSVEDVRAARAEQISPFVTVNGNTCFVSRATTYAPRCHVTPTYDWRDDPAVIITTMAIVGAAFGLATSVAQLSDGGGSTFFGSATQQNWIFSVLGGKFGLIGGLILDAGMQN